jgi:pimeloyl-ACP methyl ester carboxylesterase
MIETRVIPVSASALGNEASIAVHLRGQGPLCVLLHGYPLDHRMWLDVMHGPLAERRTLCAIDLRGHGQSPFAGDPVHSMELLANDVAAVIRTLSDDGQADVIGLSMGGYVALALWAAEPQCVRSLVLCNTKATADSEAARAGRDAAITTVLAHGRRAIAAAMLPKLLAPNADPLLQARVQSMIEGTPIETIVADLRGLKDRKDRVALLPTITVPTTVIVGELDGITPVADAEGMARGVKGARLVVVPGAAHLVPMENAAAIAAAVGH